MPDRIQRHQDVAPADRVEGGRGPDGGYFFPGEVARLLELGDIDYHQLRRVYLLGRMQAGLGVARGWARYSLHDIARVSAAIRISGGRESLIAGRRLQLKPLQEACEALRGRGYSDPLLQVPMEREGRTVFAAIDGAIVDPRTGQIVIREAFAATTRFLMDRAIQDRPLMAALRSERSTPLRGGAVKLNGGYVAL